VEKRRLYEGTEAEREAAAGVLAWVLERSLRLLHPMMPFVTEEVWQRFGMWESIVIAPWPEPHPEHRDEGSEVGFGFVEDLVTEVRRFRKAHGLPDARAIPSVQVVAPTAPQAAVLDALQQEIARLANVSSFEAGDDDGGGG